MKSNNADQPRSDQGEFSRWNADWQARENARLAAKKNESNCANQWRQNQRQGGEGRK